MTISPRGGGDAGRRRRLAGGPVAPRCLAACVALATVAFSRELRAGSRCDLRLEDAGGDVEWRVAAHEIEQTLAVEPSDCRSIVVTVDGASATVFFTTQDGRVAERRIAKPSELASLVHALLVSGLDETAPNVLGPSPAARRAPDGPAAPAIDGAQDAVPGWPADQSHVSRNDDATSFRIFTAAAAGLKASAPDADIAPIVQFAASLALDRFELGGFGRWESEHAVGDGSGAHARVSAVGGGLVGGRREAVGSVWILYGASVGAYATAVARRAPVGLEDGPHRIRHDFVQPRAGVYLGVVVPASHRLRFRAMIEGDVAMVRDTGDVADLPRVSLWAMGLTLGAETKVLP